MLLEWIGFIVLVFLGVGMILTGIGFMKVMLAFGKGFELLIPVIQLVIGGVLLYLAGINAPFSVILG